MVADILVFAGRGMITKDDTGNVNITDIWRTFYLKQLQTISSRFKKTGLLEIKKVEEIGKIILK